MYGSDVCFPFVDVDPERKNSGSKDLDMKKEDLSHSYLSFRVETRQLQNSNGPSVLQLHGRGIPTHIFCEAQNASECWEGDGIKWCKMVKNG